jgi:hypothetical protein
VPFDTAEQERDGEEVPHIPSHIQWLQMAPVLEARCQLPGNRGRTFDQQAGGKKHDRDSHLCVQPAGGCDSKVFLDREFLINEFPSSAYLQRTVQ